MNAKHILEFSEVYGKFQTNTHTVETVSELINIIAGNINYMSPASIETMLQIPLKVLRDQVELFCAEEQWINFGSYFDGNTYNKNTSWSKNFVAGTHTLEDIVNQLEDLIVNEKYSGFELRNALVVLRDDVRPKQYGAFEISGKLFAFIMERAFDII